MGLFLTEPSVPEDSAPNTTHREGEQLVWHGVSASPLLWGPHEAGTVFVLASSWCVRTPGIGPSSSSVTASVGVPSTFSLLYRPYFLIETFFPLREGVTV